MHEAIRFEDYEVKYREDGSAMELGRGAMGVTYKAWDAKLNREVALKIINQSLLSSTEDRDRFLREARALEELHHPNIATIFQVGHTEKDDLFCAMELCNGTSLDQVIKADGPFSAREALCIAGQVTLALIAAEERGWRHGDIKPTNLILIESPEEGMVVKLIDFGLARSFHAGRQTLAILGSSGLAGTAYYASPEQLEEKDHLTIQSDIYSLGACLWFALTGRPPFGGPVALAMSRTLSAELPWESVSTQPAPVVALLKKMLAKKPEDRSATAAALCVEIENCLIEDTKPLVQSEFPVLSQQTRVLPLPLRFQPVKEIAQDTTGRLFQAVNHVQKGTPVWFRLIDPALTAVPAIGRELQTQIAAARDHPHTHFINIITAEPTKDGLAIVQEYIKGFSLFELIETHGKLTPDDALVILHQLAEAADHAESFGVRGLSLVRKSVFVHFPGSPEDESFQNILKAPLEEWPPHEIKADVISLSDTELMIPGFTRESSGGEVEALVNLAYELLGGKKGKAFTPLPHLNVTTNRVLRFGCTAARAFPSATAFVKALRESLEKTPPEPKVNSPQPTPPPAKPPPSPVKSPVVARTKPRFPQRLILAGLLVMLIGDGIGYYFFFYRPHANALQQHAEKDAIAAPALKESPLVTEKLTLPPDKSDLEPPKDEKSVPAPPPVVTEKVVPAPDKVEPEPPHIEKPIPASASAVKTATSSGETVATDNEEAAGYRAKANAGDIEAARKLGLLYYEGRGVPINAAQALTWLHRAADKGDAEAQTIMGTLYFNGWGLSKNYTQAFEWHQKAANQGSSEGLLHLGVMYAGGWGIPRDYAQAFKLIQQSAQLGNPDGEANLGAMFQNGLGVPKDNDQARTWLQKAADQGNVMGQTEMGVLYAKGLGVQQDYAEALIYFQKAADQGDPGAQVHMGDMYKNGWGVQKDTSQAMQWYQKAAKAGNADAALEIQKMNDALKSTVNDSSPVK